MPVELVNAIGQRGFHFDSPNFQDGFKMALPWMVLHMGILVNISMFVRDIISASWPC